MFRLRWLIIPLWMGCVSCAVIIAGLSAGWYDWQTFVVASVLAVVIGLPAGILTTRYLRSHPRHGDGHQPTMQPDLPRWMRLRRG
jgi:hypothetical protein